MNPLVVYHKRCADGVASAALLVKFLDTEVTLLGGAYQKPPESMDIFNDRVVYLVDYSYEFSVMEEIIQRALRVVYLDHHAMAVKRMLAYSHVDKFDMRFSVMDESMSGVGCVWTWIKANTHYDDSHKPEILKYIQDRDLWKFEFGELSKNLHEYLQYRGITVSTLLGLLDYDNSDLVEIFRVGGALRKKFLNDCKSIISQCRRFDAFHGHKVAIANANGQYASEVGNLMCLDEEHPVDFAATYFLEQDTANWSLRSLKGGPDVSKIAALFGGGGHANAAGFKIKLTHPSLEMLLAVVESED